MICASSVRFLESLDPTVCARFPAGTHFVWHLMNGAMIAALLQLMIRVMTDARDTAP